VWFIADALTHLTIEASYLAFALTVTAAKSDSIFAITWKEYGKADVVCLLSRACAVWAQLGC
jgi:hypothetical protein